MNINYDSYSCLTTPTSGINTNKHNRIETIKDIT